MKKALLLLSIFALVGVGCSPAVQSRPASADPVTLEYWSVTDDFDAFEDIVEAYRAIHPNVRIEYRKFRVEEYEDELLNALAEDRGPDIFSVHNTWMREYRTKLLSLPQQRRLAFRELQGTIRPEPVWVEKVVPSMSVGQLRNAFVDQVAADAVIPTENEQGRVEDRIYGLPLALDTLALYFNRDVLNAAGIPTPARNWSEFQDHVRRGTQYDQQGKLIRPFAGIGTARNVERSFDILSLLMMQNGTEMTDANGFPTFHRFPRTMTDREIAPGVEALIFYTDFGNPAKEVFTWDDTQPNSFDAFVAGNTGYFFGYSYHLPLIRAQAPKLNFGVMPSPQIDPDFRVNYANYWLEGVSQKTEHPDIAWDFVEFMTNADNAKSYLDATAKPTALRSLINGQLSDDDLAPFAEQALTAKSWYRGNNIDAAESAFSDMIRSVLAGEEPRRAIGLAADTVSQTIGR